MAIFTVTIIDSPSLAGITAARNNYNSNLPQVQQVDAKGVPVVDKNGAPVYVSPTPGTLNTDNDYVQFVMANAALSYAKQFNLTITAAQKTAMQATIATASVVG